MIHSGTSIASSKLDDIFPLVSQPVRYLRMLLRSFFLCRLTGINLISGGADGFMEMTISSVSSLCFRIEAESSRGHRDRQRISKPRNLI
jgi:hypothetical protein